MLVTLKKYRKREQKRLIVVIRDSLRKAADVQAITNISLKLNLHE